MTPSIHLNSSPWNGRVITQFLLDVDGKPCAIRTDPDPRSCQFPGPVVVASASVNFTPAIIGLERDHLRRPWALFRMFDDVKMEETKQPERFVAAISVAGRRAVFEILASRVRNPFRLSELSQFRCPTAL